MKLNRFTFQLTVEIETKRVQREENAIHNNYISNVGNVWGSDLERWTLQ